MPTVEIEAKGCRGCSLCKDICPTDVFDVDATTGVARAARVGDCIGCTSCEYICPSRCLTVGETSRQRPFHRIEENAALVARFLQQTPIASALGAADVEEALRDVSVRLAALGDSVVETMGRGQRAVGRRSGKLAAEHLPDLYEGFDLGDVLRRMQRRFAGSFPFTAVVASGGDSIAIDFERCALEDVARAQGQEPGRAVLCVLFHEYWAGLLSEFGGKNYAVEAADSGRVCSLRLSVRA
ncbi:MAG: 4Fe-4S dicluster domain-containing protein [Polyangiaceae bacterium]|nr:4Fe-4S dicluster domain-containing protein [Polyangiaceae bacterium]